MLTWPGWIAHRWRTEESPLEESKSLDRALQLLFELAKNPQGLSATELARRLSTQRPPLYRTLRTLLRYRMITRDEGKLYRLGTGVLELAQFVSGSIIDEVQPILQRAADAAALTAMLVVKQNDDIVTLTTAKPSKLGMYIDTAPGFVHPTGDTAPRIAMRALAGPTPEDPDEVRRAREDGVATTHGAALAGRTAIASGFSLGTARQDSAVLFVTMENDETRLNALRGIAIDAAAELREFSASPIDS